MIAIRPIMAMIMILLITLSACTAGAPPIAESPPTPPAYKLGAGDKLRVTVFGEEALSREYAITSAGDISFPLLGDIPVAGQTASQLADVLTKKLGSGYINDPRVSVEVLNYRPFFILGEVERAGSFPYVADLSALQAVAIAGGYTYRADKRRVFIRRAGQTEERTYVLSPDQPVWVMPGDTVRIGERYF